MSLCSAWKIQDTVSVIADTRVSAYRSENAEDRDAESESEDRSTIRYDHFCKLNPIAARINGPTVSYQRVWAIAYAGNHDISSFLLSFILNFVGDLYIAEDTFDLSVLFETLFDKCDGLVQAMHNTFGWKVKEAPTPEILDIDNIPSQSTLARSISILIAGYCPTSRTVRVFKWAPDNGVKEVLLDETSCFIGSSVEIARNTFVANQGDMISTFATMSNQNKAIGPTIIGGVFQDGDFRLRAIRTLTTLLPITGATKMHSLTGLGFETLPVSEQDEPVLHIRPSLLFDTIQPPR